MANEILYSGLGDLTTAANLASRFHLLLAARDSSFLGHPAIFDAGFATPGSIVMQVPQLGMLGYDLMASGTEGTAPSNTALTDGSSSITLAIYEKVYQNGDLARMTDAYGFLDTAMFAQDLAVTTAQTLISILAALSTGFSTNVVGSSGVDLTVSDFTDGITLLEVANVAGSLAAVLHPRQWGDMRTNSLTLAGAVEHRPDVQGLASYAGQSYKGSVFGVDTFVSSRCPDSDAAANENGVIFGSGALLMGKGQFVPEADPNILDLAIPGAPVMARLERDRDGRSGLTSHVMRTVMGVIEGIDGAGCRVRSDA